MARAALEDSKRDTLPAERQHVTFRFVDAYGIGGIVKSRACIAVVSGVLEVQSQALK